MSSEREPSFLSRSLPEKLTDLGFQLNEDGVLSAETINNCQIEILSGDQCKIITPDGKEFVVRDVKKIKIKEIGVSGKGKVGITI